MSYEASLLAFGQAMVEWRAKCDAIGVDFSAVLDEAERLSSIGTVPLDAALEEVWRDATKEPELWRR